MFRTREEHLHEIDPTTLIILAFSGGGTRAAAFSYGVLEALRRSEIVGPQGKKGRLLDEVDIITGVSGGSFTALAYGLYGEKLFDIYEASFPETQRPGRTHPTHSESGSTGEAPGQRVGAAPKSRRSSTMTSCFTAPHSLISTVATAR